jgi:protein-L-isoaspartate(D-aspartate) O-methyltransferase
MDDILPPQGERRPVRRDALAPPVRGALVPVAACEIIKKAAGLGEAMIIWNRSWPQDRRSSDIEVLLRIVFAVVAILGVLLDLLAAPGKDDDPFASRRKAMVAEQVAARGVRDSAVLEALRSVPRHLFVPAELRGEAYGDFPLPIGEGQTISQPYIVGLMTESLNLGKGDRVLEIGTGSGYQAAVISLLAAMVYSVEINERLARRAGETLAELGYANVRVKSGDGFFGWPEEAPFDAIIVTCAVDRVPPRLFNQLAEGGRLVLPLGDSQTYQQLTLITKRGGKMIVRKSIDVRFVPMTGEALKKRGTVPSGGDCPS